MAFYIFHSLASNSRRTYSSPQKQFINFCHSNLLYNASTGGPIPASELTLCRFAAHLAEKTDGPNAKTIKQYLSAVNSLHTEEGYPSPSTLGFNQLQKVCKGISRVKGEKPTKPRLPISYEILSSFATMLDLSVNRNLVFITACAVGFFGLLRSGEMTFASFDGNFDLSRSSVSFFPSLSSPTRVDIIVPSSKTDPFRVGVTITLGLTGKLVCPVLLLQRLFLQFPLPDSSPLFQLPSRRAFTKKFLITAVRSLLPLINLDSSLYSGHSFRIGGATAAAAAGMTHYEIQILGRWRSDAYLLYVKIPIHIRASLAARLAS